MWIHLGEWEGKRILWAYMGPRREVALRCCISFLIVTKCLLRSHLKRKGLVSTHRPSKESQP